MGFFNSPLGINSPTNKLSFSSIGGDIFSQINFAEAAKEGKVGFWIGAGLGISAATVRQSKQEIY